MIYFIFFIQAFISGLNSSAFFFPLSFVSISLYSVTVITFLFTSAELIVISFISVKSKLLPVWSFMEPFFPLRCTFVPLYFASTKWKQEIIMSILGN